MKKIYVGGLPYSIGEDDLSNMFTPYGEVSSSKIIMDRESGRSKGFGFIEMESDEAATKAIAELHEAQLDGRTLTVNEARPMEPRSGAAAVADIEAVAAVIAAAAVDTAAVAAAAVGKTMSLYK
jgi:cold-inducible RNA-binding protein